MNPLRLALANLRHKPARTAVAVAGVTFAVTLIFMEIGMFGGIKRTATMFFDALRFDLLVASNEYIDLGRPGDIARGRVARAAAVPGVESVAPLSIGFGGWREPASRGLFGAVKPPGAVNSIFLVAAPPTRLAEVFTTGPGGVFDGDDAARAAGAKLARLDTFLIDEKSSGKHGTFKTLKDIPPDGRDVRDARGEPHREAVRLNGKRAEVVGTFRLGTGFSWNGMLMCGEETFGRFTPRPDDRVTFALVRVGTRDARGRPDPAELARVKADLEAALPPDVRVYTSAEIRASEQRYWVRATSVGQFIQVAVILAVVVGVIFVYQMMAADIQNMLPEYATVKALGYRPPYLTGVVLAQALLLAGSGYALGLAAAVGLYWAARTVGGIPTVMTPDVAGLVLALACGMCLASGLLAVRKVHAADPADLF
jgi:putative ABC transport system permease protein